MKQTEIALKFGIDPTALNKILNGRYKTIPARIAVKLAIILKMPVAKVIETSPAELKRRFFELHEF